MSPRARIAALVVAAGVLLSIVGASALAGFMGANWLGVLATGVALSVASLIAFVVMAFTPSAMVAAADAADDIAEDDPWESDGPEVCITRPDGDPEADGHDCYAGFHNLLSHMANNLEAHADRDGLSGAARAVFLARGGHAPGTACPTEVPLEPLHVTWCEWPDDECGCPPGHFDMYGDRERWAS